jgi:hypothetical protein
MKPIVMSAKDYLSEHKHLIKVLKQANTPKTRLEAQNQLMKVRKVKPNFLKKK